jgi:hypothetical protein
MLPPPRMVASLAVLTRMDVLPQALAGFGAERASHTLVMATCAAHGDVELAGPGAEDGHSHDRHACNAHGPDGGAMASRLRDDGHDAGLRWQQMSRSTGGAPSRSCGDTPFVSTTVRQDTDGSSPDLDRRKRQRCFAAYSHRTSHVPTLKHATEVPPQPDGSLLSPLAIHAVRIVRRLRIRHKRDFPLQSPVWAALCEAKRPRASSGWWPQDYETCYDHNGDTSARSHPYSRQLSCPRHA